MTNPAEIAARLTAEERKALLWLPRDGRARSVSGAPSMQPLAGRYGDSELMEWVAMYQARLTPLGVAVRAVIERENGDG